MKPITPSKFSPARACGSVAGLLAICLAFAAPGHAQVNNVALVPAGATWHYLDQGFQPPLDWTTRDFDDGNWASGPAQFGYGDGDEATVVSFGFDPNFKHPTTYFRHSFVLEDPTPFTNLTVRLLRDDGGIVYLNGIEIFRSNMPLGQIGYFTLAASTIPNSDESVFFSRTLDADLLVRGTNVVAVEIHQAAFDSSDLSFDLSLAGAAVTGPPIIIRQPKNLLGALGGSVTFSVRAAGATPLTYQWAYEGMDLQGETNSTLRLTNLGPETEGRYWVTVNNALGSVVSDKASLSLVNLSGDFFQITELSGQNATAIEHSGVTGQDRGGIAASFDDLLLTGDSTTARFNLADLSGGTPLGRIHDALASDLRSGTLYVLGRGMSPFPAESTIDSLLEVDGASGQLTGESVPLSVSIGLNSCYGCMGIFSGFGRIALHNNERLYSILLPSGQVVDHGPVPLQNHQFSENWFYWGVAEYFDETLWIAYVRDAQTIVRTRVPSGPTLPVATFNNLSDMASFTVSPLLSRWYFHHEGNSQFRAGQETVGFASAQLAHENQSQPPAILLDPRDRRAPQGSNATFSVSALGFPLRYQWRFNGEAILDATNRMLTLAGVGAGDVGLYSVTISNALGMVTSAPALLNVVSGTGTIDTVAVLGGESNFDWNSDVRTKLDATGLFNQVDAFQVTSGFPTPSLSQLEQYDAVLVYSDNGFQDSVAMGNVLADYVDRGGGLVMATFAFTQIAGRIVAGDYLPFSSFNNVAANSLTLEALIPGHPILDGIDSFRGGFSSYHHSSTSLRSNAELVARWSNSEPLVATTETSGGRVVGLNFFPPSSDARNDFWDASSDGALLMANALVWSGGGGGETVPGVAPGIRAHPSDTTVLEGLDGRLTVHTFGSPPLSYQWYREGELLADATNATLVVINAMQNDAGAYHVVISNASGTVTSDSAMLEVESTRGVAGYYTDFNASSTGLVHSIIQAGYSPLRIDDVETVDLSRLDLLLLDVPSEPMSPALRRFLPRLPAWITGGGRLIVHQSYLNEPETLTSNPLLVGASGIAFDNFYHTDINVLLPANNLVVMGPHGTLNNASLDGDEVAYTAYAQRASLPQGTLSILSAGPNTSQVLAFSYGLGAGLVYYSSIPIHHYLNFSASPLATTMRQVYVPNVIEYAAAYTPSGPPVITRGPSHVVATEGTSASFFVAVRGQAPLQYQWLFEGVPLPGTTQNPLLLSNVQPANAGSYSLRVTNTLGSATSASALLTVVPRRSVAIFSDLRHVDSAQNNEALIQQLGHEPRPFTNLLAGLAHEVIVMPDFVFRWLGTDLDQRDHALLQAYVAQGGVLIFEGGYGNVELMNSLFGLTLSPQGCFVGIPLTRTAAAAGTPFAAAPAFIPGNTCTYTLEQSSLPPDARAIYVYESLGSAVTLIPYGAGTLVHLGWNFFDSVPLGSQDGGWSQVLASAIQSKGALNQPGIVSIPLVLSGAPWRYLDDNSNQGTVWREPEYNDTAWPVGQAQLGYGDGDEATVIGFGPDPNNKFVTTYFRHSFMVEQPSAFSNLTLHLLRDDGAAVYLNGVEIARDCLAPNADFRTYASCTIADADENIFLTYSVPANRLREGNNVLAVEVHQVNATSSDLSFDLRLTATAPLGAPIIRSQPADRSVLINTSVGLSVVASGVPPLSYQWRREGEIIQDATNAILLLNHVAVDQAGRYSVTVSNALGMVSSSEALLTVLTLSGDTFRIAQLSTNNVTVVDDGPLAGDDQGGLAASAELLFYTGGGSTVAFALADLTEGTPLGRLYDGLVSDLKTEKVYVLASGSNPFPSEEGVVTRLIELDGTTGELTERSVSLSEPIDLRDNYGEIGLFSGFGRIVIHDGWRARSIELPSGMIVDLGQVTVPEHAYSESWAYWGVAESFDDSLHLVYVRDPQSIVRTRLSDGLTETVAAFDNLSDMSSITVSILYNRWYFHHQHPSQFSSFDLTTGFAEAAFESSAEPVGPQITRHPADRIVSAGGTVKFQVAARGTGPLQYQWFQDDTPLPNATNSTLVLSPTSLSQSGRYSVAVSNAVASVLSSEAVLTVVGLGEATLQIAELTPNHPGIAPLWPLIGGTRGGLAASSERIFYSGEPATASFSITDFTGGRATSTPYQALISDLATETVYSLAHGTHPFGTVDRVVDSLLELDGLSGEPTGTRITLSEPIDLNNRIEVGLFAGFGRIVITDGYQGWRIDLPSGQVLSLGPLALPERRVTSHGFLCGVAEQFDDLIWLVYVRDSQSIVRTRLPDGATSAVAEFEELGNMDAITISLALNRWYFHQTGDSQFSNLAQIVGFADASFVSSGPVIAPSVLLPPHSQTVAAGGTAEFRVAVRGTGPLQYQWLFDGSVLFGETHPTLTLSGVNKDQAGLYSVMVTNSAGTDTSTPGQLTIIDTRPIAVFDDPQFVYTDGSPHAGSDSIQASLALLGHQVSTFLNVSTAAQGTDTLLFPALEASDLASTLSTSARDALRTFVAQGGTIILHGAYNDASRAANLLNTVFEFATEAAYPTTLGLARTPQADGTFFEGGPEELLLNQSTTTLLLRSLPPGAKAIYTNGDMTAVALMPYGSGRVIFLGWTWSDATPLGHQDGGWLNVLGRAVQEAAPPAPSAPEILVHPRDRTVQQGSSARFSVLATGYPLLYQWFHNGGEVQGATNYLLELSDVTMDQAGLYSVVVSNALGSIASIDARLEVVPRLFVGVFDDARLVDTSGGVGASDALQLGLQQLGYLARPFTNIPAAVTNQVLVFPSFELGDSSSVIDAGSRAALESFVAQGGLMIVHGNFWNVEFLNAVLGTSISFHGYVGGTFTRNPQTTGTPFAEGPFQLPYNAATFSLSAASLPGLGGRSLYAAADVCPVALIPHGAGTIVFLGWNWFDAVPVGTQDNGWLDTLDNAVATRLGFDPGEPVLTAHPQDLTLLEGLDASFTAKGYGGPPLRAQWFMDGEPLPGATNATLAFTAAPEHNGEYHVVFSNPSGSTTSQVARLIVRPTRGVVGYYLESSPISAFLPQAIETAGFTPSPIPDVSAFDLSRLDALMVDTANGESAILTLARPKIERWVTEGGKLIVHEWPFSPLPDQPRPLLIGAPATRVITELGQDLGIIPPGDNVVVAGPHGMLDNLSLDNGDYSHHGYVPANSLPVRALPILSVGLDTNRVAAFAYGAGAGSVYYSTFSLGRLFEFEPLGPRVRTIYVPNLLEHAFTFSVTGPPIVMTQPSGTGALEGGDAQFSVIVSGQSPLSYQWYLNDALLPGATDSTLVLSNLTQESAGSYRVEISNAQGSISSAAAILQLVRPALFRITSLGSTGSQVVDHDSLTGDDRGGIGISSTHVFYTGDSSTARFSAANLSGGTSLGRYYDAMVSNLRTETLYTLATDFGVVDSGSSSVTALIEINGSTGILTSNRIPLSSPVPLGFGTGIFSGYDAVVLHNGTRVYRIELPSGLVVDLGPMSTPNHFGCENWAYWGVAEFFDNSTYIDYVRDNQTIVRTRVPDGETTTLGSFSNLSDMCSFTVSVPRGRWYFHYEGNGQFGGFSETIGYATAVFETPPRFVSALPDRLINEDSTTGAILVTIADNSPAPQLMLRAVSSNSELLPESGVVLSGTGANRSLTLTPALDEFGTSMITLTLTDPLGQSTNATFMLTVNPVNDPPSFLPGPSQYVLKDSAPHSIPGWATDIRPGPSNEAGQTLAFIVENDSPTLFVGQPAIDSDGTLTFAPSGLAGTAVVTAILRDDGGLEFGGADSSSPAQFAVFVLNALNSPPELTPIPDQTAYVLTPFVVTNIANDADVPPNSILFQLGASSPTNAFIDPLRGEVIWLPAREDARSSVMIEVIATDDGFPPLSATSTFRVNVADYIELNLGPTVVRAGETGQVDVVLFSSTGVTNVSFGFDAPQDRLTNFIIDATAPELSDATLEPAGSGGGSIRFGVAPGQTLSGSHVLGQLRFVAPPGQPSAFIPLTLWGLEATQSTGTPMPKTIAGHGRVAVIGDTPLLQAIGHDNGLYRLVIYGNAGEEYTLESTGDLVNPAAWRMRWQGILTAPVQILDLGESGQTIFYRLGQ